MNRDPIYLALLAGLGVSWIVVYLLIIYRGFADRTYGMPIVALCGNVAWEFQFAFIAPYETVQRSADTIWFILDLLIIITVIRYGPRQFPTVPTGVFYAMFAGGIIMAYTGIALLSRELGQAGSVYTGFGDTMLMSALFIAMLHGRGSTAGQSMTIGYLKWFGTAFGVVAYCVFDENYAGDALLIYMGISIFVLDGIYAISLHLTRRAEKAGEDSVGGLTNARYQVGT